MLTKERNQRAMEIIRIPRVLRSEQKVRETGRPLYEQAAILQKVREALGRKS